ncbi:myosin-binding protein H-like isoform X3 [Moschus berezovskii]|uniref:myosin-binding protein H-like isoform X3 n=1 Tax=Moschus berezovskii TaxID=68408 RepID=UPI002443BDF8|nr:myosin-binding protein H-like isoform X3 [Moschus berezovskii]
MKTFPWSPASGWPSMEATTAPEAALGPTLKVKEASPADADGPQASPRRGAGSPLPQLLPPIEEHPKIWLPRALRQTCIRKVGDTVNLLIPFQGKPKPQAIWTRDGCALDTSRRGRALLRASSWWMSGAPALPWSGLLPKTWAIRLSWDTRCRRLTPNLGGFTPGVFWGHLQLWFTVLERYHRTSCTVSNLIVGNSYAFRVFAENQCGLSENAPVTADLAHIQKAATVYKTEGFAQRDFSEAPKFTQPLADCTTVIGYDTQLFCCVRASPKPKIIWLKNKMDIQGNPKYRALTYLGICSLEIRKPGPFDGGIYTCKAVNALGEASVDCRVAVTAPN